MHRLSLPTCLIACACSGVSALPAPRASDESITAPAHEPRWPFPSPGVMGGGIPVRAGMNIASMSLGASELDVLIINDAARGEPTNHRGERVAAAPVRFYEDFESGELGPEWSAFGGTRELESLTRFADPSRPGGMVLNVKTESDSAYEVRLDIYLIPPAAGAAAEQSDNVLTIFVDGEPAFTFDPAAFALLPGKSAAAVGALVRVLHVPFTAAHRIAEIRFESPSGAPSDWFAWGIDNLVIDLGLQDPVFGVSGGGGGYDSGLLGSPEMGDMTGEIPSLPKSRYGSNEPFAGDGGGGGGGGGGNDPFDPPPNDPPRDDPDDPSDPGDPEDPGDPPDPHDPPGPPGPPGDPEDPFEPRVPDEPPEVPLPSAATSLLFALAAARMGARRR